MACFSFFVPSFSFPFALSSFSVTHTHAFAFFISLFAPPIRCAFFLFLLSFSFFFLPSLTVSCCAHLSFAPSVFFAFLFLLVQTARSLSPLFSSFCLSFHYYCGSGSDWLAFASRQRVKAASLSLPTPRPPSPCRQAGLAAECARISLSTSTRRSPLHRRLLRAAARKCRRENSAKAVGGKEPSGREE